MCGASPAIRSSTGRGMRAIAGTCCILRIAAHAVVTQCLKDAPGVFVAASDYLKVLPDSIDRWLPRPLWRLAPMGSAAARTARACVILRGRPSLRGRRHTVGACPREEDRREGCPGRHRSVQHQPGESEPRDFVTHPNSPSRRHTSHHTNACGDPGGLRGGAFSSGRDHDTVAVHSGEIP